MGPERIPDSIFAGRLALPVDALRVDRIGLDIGRRLGAVEDVVRRHVNEPAAPL